MQSEYPAQYEKTLNLRDESRIFLRPIKPTDDALMIEMFNSLSAETIHLRFFSTLKHMSKEQLEKFTHIDYEKQMAIVALMRKDDRDKIVAVGRYNLLEDEPGAAEFAIVVRDIDQGRGIGTEVLNHLAHVAKLQGVHRIIGYILNENSRMFAMLRRSGLKMTTKNWDRGIARVDIPIDENIQIQ